MVSRFKELNMKAFQCLSSLNFKEVALQNERYYKCQYVSGQTKHQGAQ
jgi:hypothetical protein